MNNIRLSNAFWIESDDTPAYWVVRKEDGSEPRDYPVEVLDVNGISLGIAANKTEYMNAWNANAGNVAAKGYLIGEYNPFVFEIRKRVLGGVRTEVEFASGQTFTIGGLRALKSFRVGDAGQLQAGDVRFTDAALLNKKLLVIADGLGLPMDDGSNDVDFTGVIERYVKKVPANNYIDFMNGGVVDKEIITIYEIF